MLIASWVFLGLTSLLWIALPHRAQQMYQKNTKESCENTLVIIWAFEVVLGLTLGLWITGTIWEPKNLTSEIMALICSIWFLLHLIVNFGALVEEMQNKNHWEVKVLINFAIPILTALVLLICASLALANVF